MTGTVRISLSTIFCGTQSLWGCAGIQALMNIDHGGHRLVHRVLESELRPFLRFESDSCMTRMSHGESEFHKPTAPDSL